RQVVSIGHVLDARIVATLPVQIDRDDRCRQPSSSRAAAQLLLQQVRVHFPCGGRCIDEGRRGANVRDGIGRRGEGQRRRDNVVAPADTERRERQVQGGGAARQRNRKWDVDRRREFVFECVHVGTKRCDPVRI